MSANKKILIILAIAVSGLISACGEVGVKPEKRAELNTNFYQHWVQALEEQGGNTSLNIFRPFGSQDFGGDDFRMEFKFDINGRCQYKTTSNAMRNCVFTKIGKKVYLYDDQGKLISPLIFTLVEEPSQEKLRLSYGIKSPIAKVKSKEKK